MSATIHYQAEGGIARLTLDQQAKHNALSIEMWSMLPDLVRRAAADPDVRVVMVTGAGSSAFCAGADISQFGERRSGEGATRSYDGVVGAALGALASIEKPTLAAIQGICFGGGMMLALSCDLRVASSDARFRVPAGRLGLGYGYGSVTDFVHRLGRAATADILFTARIIEAAEALRLGIVQRVFAADLPAEAELLAADIAANAPLTLAAVKRALVEGEKSEGVRDIGAVDALVARCFSSADYQEGQAAFRERRTPRFQGR